MRLLLCVLVLCVSENAVAISKGYDANGEVVLKDGVPCFFAQLEDRDRSQFGLSVSVGINGGPEVWHLYDDRGQALMPSSANECIKYGARMPNAKTLTESMPLKYGVPYFADIEAKRLFRVSFCLSRDARGEALLTKWSNDGDHCSDKPLNDTEKPSLWKRFLGK
jgi:hypothetical protein